MDELTGNLRELADDGWAVQEHRHFLRDGKSRIVWVFEKGDINIQGDGKTDAEAIRQVMVEWRGQRRLVS